MVDETTSQNLQAKQLPDFDLAYSVLHKVPIWMFFLSYFYYFFVFVFQKKSSPRH